MAKRVVLMMLITGAVLGAGVPAPAAETERTVFQITAPVACGIACPYWTDYLTGRGACDPAPITPPGSFDERRLVVPSTVRGRPTTHLAASLHPYVDYDLFLCRVRNPGATHEEYVQVAEGAPLDCQWIESPGPGVEYAYRCREDLSVPVKPGQVYVLRAYNWADGPYATAEYTWAAAR